MFCSADQASGLAHQRISDPDPLKISMQSLFCTSRLITEPVFVIRFNNVSSRSSYGTLTVFSVVGSEPVSTSYDKTTALDIIYRTYDVLTGSDPTTENTVSVPYEDLEDTLLNLMTKTGSVMSRDVQKEIALIFSRGQGPIYVDELGQMLDLLSKTRFLDVILLKDDPIYSALNSEWGAERLTLVAEPTITDLLEKSSDVSTHRT